jgi:hypothetical protein
VFQRFRKAGIRLRLNKCHFCWTSLSLLGHRVGSWGTAVQESQVEKVRSIPTPKTVKDVRSFLGLAGYYRRFVPNFSTIARPLNNLLRKDNLFQWTPDCMTAFEQLKKALTSAPILARPDFDKAFLLSTDASKKGLGAVLSQHDDEGRERVISYASRGLTPAEKNYSATELECLAVVWAVGKYKHYLHGSNFTLTTDHQALQWLLKTSRLPENGRLCRWITKLQSYTFTPQYRQGRKNQNADALSRLGF